MSPSKLVFQLGYIQFRTSYSDPRQTIILLSSQMRLEATLYNIASPFLILSARSIAEPNQVARCESLGQDFAIGQVGQLSIHCTNVYSCCKIL